ncbi:DUF4365 domain-containing protein [Flagellimonas sp.]|uniref:DUF4365 domain-containing protein n=1 Tax=Flagellimonas sp. TaxID=2058762 RepID=UPI003AB17726
MTKRNPNIKTEKQGVRFLQGVVEDNHSIFHEFSRENDQGNDCYIEFVSDGYATNYGVFVQIKSGNSYKDKSGYKIKAKQDHLGYWNKALTLTIGVVYDPDIGKAFWVDISSYLSRHPKVLHQHNHTIRIEREHELNEETFPKFMDYCMRSRERYANYDNYGHSLEWFASTSEPETCYEGLKSLYANHREKPSTWFYILSTFSKIRTEGIRRNILGLLSNYVNPDIFRQGDHIHHLPSNDTVHDLNQLMTTNFRHDEIVLALPYMEDGITRGSFSYLVFLVLNMVEDIHLILRDLAFKPEFTEERRHFCFWLYLQTAKFHSIEDTLRSANAYMEKFPSAKDDEAIMGVKEAIENGELWPVG